jgi:D-aspartate ligase
MNIQTPPANSPPAVLCGAYYTGLNVARNLSRRGVEIHLLDHSPTQIGMYSRHGKKWLGPNPDQEPEAWIEFMREMARQLGRKAVLIPSSDLYVTAVARWAEELSRLFLFPLAGSQVQGALASKQTQYDLALRYGMPISKTAFVSNLDGVETFAAETMYPCLFKPLAVRDWERVPPGHLLYGIKVVLADTPADLLAKYKIASEITPNVVLQEIIEGDDMDKRIYISAYSHRDGRRLGFTIMRCLRSQPPLFGVPSVIEPVNDPETAAICDEWFRRIGYQGAGEIELKRDRRDGRVKMIESNPRISGSGDSAFYDGVDTGWLYYLDMIGVEVEEARSSRQFFRHIMLQADSSTIHGYLERGLLDWRGILEVYRGRVYFFDLDWKDPNLAWRTLRDTLKGLLFPYYKRMRSWIGR